MAKAKTVTKKATAAKAAAPTLAAAQNNLSEATVHVAIGSAVAAACRATPLQANGVLINELKSNLGPFVQEAITVIKSGVTNLPEILAALTAAGVVLPSWAQLVISILVPIVAGQPAS